MSQGRPNIDRLKRKRVVSALADALRHEDVVVQLDAAAALRDLVGSGEIKWEPRGAHERVMVTQGGPAAPIHGEAAIPTLISLVRGLIPKTRNGYDHDPRGGELIETTQRLIRSLGAIGGDEAVDFLISLLDRNSGYAVDAADALAALGEVRAVEPLLRLVRAKEDSDSTRGHPLAWQIMPRSLDELLRKTAPVLPDETLKSVLALRNDDIGMHAGAKYESAQVPYKHLMVVAEKELLRRGGLGDSAQHGGAAD